MLSNAQSMSSIRAVVAAGGRARGGSGLEPASGAGEEALLEGPGGRAGGGLYRSESAPIHVVRTAAVLSRPAPAPPLPPSNALPTSSAHLLQPQADSRKPPPGAVESKPPTSDTAFSTPEPGSDPRNPNPNPKLDPETPATPEEGSHCKGLKPRKSVMDRAMIIYERKKSDLAGMRSGSDKPTWLLDPRSRFFRRWDVWTGLLLLYTAIVTPFEVAFIQDSVINGLWVINRVVDVTFISDLCMQFFLPIQDPESGEYLTNHRLIVVSYLRGWFFIDLISTLPFDMVEMVTGQDTSDLKIMRLVRLLRLVKLMRLLRAARMFQRWESTMEINYAMLDLNKFALAVVAIAHWLACGWRMLIGVTREESTRLNWVNHYEVVDADDDWAVYLAAVYWAVATLSTLGYGDVVPVNDSERFFVVLATMIGGSLYAYMVGSVCGLLSSMNEANAHFYKTIDHLNAFMNEKKFPTAMKWRLREYFRFRRDNDMSDHQHNLLMMMSGQLRGEVAEHVHAKWINEVPFFHGCPSEFITEMALNLKVELFSASELVIKRGDISTKMYIVEKGIVGANGRVIGAGRTFGTDVLGHAGRRRTYQAMTLTNTVVLTLHRNDLEAILSYYPDVRVRIRKQVVRTLCYDAIMAYVRAVTSKEEPVQIGHQLSGLLMRHQMEGFQKGNPLKFKAFVDAAIVVQKCFKMSRVRRRTVAELSFRRELSPAQGLLVVMLDECALTRFRSKLLHDQQLCIHTVAELSPEALLQAVNMPLGAGVRLLKKVRRFLATYKAGCPATGAEEGPASEAEVRLQLNKLNYLRNDSFPGYSVD